MLISPLYKYVASPQAFAYMPPVLAGCSVIFYSLTSMLSLVAGISTIFSLVIAIAMCAGSAFLQMKEPHIHNMIMTKQKFMQATPGYKPHKGKFYAS